MHAARRSSEPFPESDTQVAVTPLAGCQVGGEVALLENRVDEIAGGIEDEDVVVAALALQPV